MEADGRKRQRADLSFLSDMRLDGLLGGRRLSWIRRGRDRQLRRPEFSGTDHCSVGGDATPVGFATVGQARGGAGVSAYLRYRGRLISSSAAGRRDRVSDGQGSRDQKRR